MDRLLELIGLAILESQREDTPYHWIIDYEGASFQGREVELYISVKKKSASSWKRSKESRTKLCAVNEFHSTISFIESKLSNPNAQLTDTAVKRFLELLRQAIVENQSTSIIADWRIDFESWVNTLTVAWHKDGYNLEFKGLEVFTAQFDQESIIKACNFIEQRLNQIPS